MRSRTTTATARATTAIRRASTALLPCRGPTGGGVPGRHGRSNPASVQTLHEHGHALAAADAHRLEADGLVERLQVVQQRGHDAGAGLPERVTEGDGPAVGVELRLDVDAELV